MRRKPKERRKKQGQRQDGKRPISEVIGKRFEIDADKIRGGSRVEICGRGRVELGGLKKIDSYSDTCVRVLADEGILSVRGERLECVFYRRGEVAVEGRIDSVSYEV